MYLILAQIEIIESADKKVNWVNSSNIALSIIAGTILIVLIYLIFRWFRGRSPSANVMVVANKEMRQKIHQALGREQYEKAGELLSRQGDHADAGEAYAKGRSYSKAARSFLAAGNEAQAIFYFKQADENEQAAKIYAGRKEYMSAAAEYLGIKAYNEAARFYQKASDYRRAAECYVRSKDFHAAGECFEKSGHPMRAAKNYHVFFDSEFDRVAGDLSKFEGVETLASNIGELYEDAGDSKKAAYIFRKAGLFSRAAGAMQSTGDFASAAEMLIKADQPLAAAEILEQAGQGKRAFAMRAEDSVLKGDFEEAAELFVRAEQPERAAEIYQQLEKFFEAGELFEKSAHLKEAVQCYEKANKFAHAARTCEVLQDWVRAADFSRKAGDVEGEIRALFAERDFFRAGRLQFEHRRYAEAIDTLSNIESTNPLYPRSLELQGDAFRGQSRFEKAYSRYRASLGNRNCDVDTLHLFYKMGRSLEEENDLTGAIGHYKKILGIDKTFEDADLRVQTIRRRLKHPTVPGVTSSGIFSAPAGISAPRYEILNEVARGGMGIVYKARDTVLGRIVAYKILGENLRDNETAVKYFLREARAAAALSHPNIVTIFDAGEQEGEYYMAMEFVEGTTLKQVVKRRGSLPEEQVRFIGVHCCRALAYAHSKGIVHRDIKSGNVMITRDKALKIMDFGLAKFMREYQKEHTQQVGTPFYMSPEQIIGKNIDFRSDLYSVGCTIFECATGRVPFKKGDLSYHHVHTAPPDPKALNPSISTSLQKVILRLLEKKPDNRYQNAQEVIDAIMASQ